MFIRGVSLAVLVLTSAAARGDEPPDKHKQDLEAFKKYLADKHPGKKWQTGPTPLDSKELRKAYLGR